MNETFQPQFWLQVRKEYVIDNFENLMNYMRYYTYNPRQINPDYESTLECMTSICDEIGEKVKATPLYGTLELPYDTNMVLKLLCATILGTNAMDRPVHSLLLTLTSLILHMDCDVDDRKIYDIIIGAMQRKEINSLGFTWDSISPKTGEFNLNVLLLQISKLTYKSLSEDAPTLYVEKQGLFMLPPGGMPIISTVNRADVEKDKYDLQLTLPNTLDIYDGKGEYENYDSMRELASIASRLYSRQKSMRQSPKVMLREYDIDDTFPVRISYKYEKFILAETIDGSYTPITGKLYVNFDKDRPDTRTLFKMLNVGDIIPVCRSHEQDFAFETLDAYEDFYREYASEFADTEVDAIYIGYYPTGTKWLSREGIRISLPNEKFKDLTPERNRLLQNAQDTLSPIKMRLYKNPPDRYAENFNVYAQLTHDFSYEYDNEVPDRFSREEADREVLTAWLEYGAELAAKIPVKNRFGEMTVDDCSALIKMLHRMGMNRRHDCRSWYIFDLAAAMMCRLCEHTSYYEYLVAEQEYIMTIATFAANGEVKEFKVSDKFAEIPEVVKRQEIVESLREYSKPDESKHKVEITLKTGDEQDNVLEKVRTLVGASNSLRDIITLNELDNIKRAIARLLGVNEEYESILDNRTFYGQENISLEFKGSAVCPPENLRTNPTICEEPEMQKWVLLKAVCGFLNSRAGGDLLIGVNDAGYAIGLESDVKDLYAQKLIPVPDADHMRTYLQNIFDKAFVEKGGTTAPQDISRSYISVALETNAENRNIIRVHVRPYTKKIINIADPQRPAWAYESYLRKEGRTVRMTPVLEKYVLSYK